VVGLGAGTLAAYAHADQQWTFYEIDSAVARIARTTAYFTYLADCGGRCAIVIGDARQSLAHADGARYDLIVLDAFSSDAIPLHLLTREALRVYLDRLGPGGVLAFHISNRHLSLAPVLARLAESEHLATRDWLDDEGKRSFADGKTPAEWMLMARSEGDLGPIAADARWSAIKPPTSTPLWTDDFTNIWSVLKRR
jgi:SAM-dependent methyltransferase